MPHPDAIVNSPEAQILLCCSRATVDAEAAAGIRALVEDGPDWERLIALALRHGVTPLLHRALVTACPDAVPAELLDALGAQVEGNSDRVRRLAKELSAIVADCRHGDVQVIPFKGPTLALQAYGDMTLRSAGDLDLMLREDDLPVLHQVLGARGFRRSDGPAEPLPPHLDAAYRRYQCEQIFVRPQDMMVVEPQWAIGARTLAYSLDYDAMRAEARPIAFEGGEVPAFAAGDLLLLLCVHGTKHYWAQLRWIADIAAMLAHGPELDLEACLEGAGRQGCGRTVLLGLALAERLLAADLPRGISDRIRADRACARLVGDTIQVLFDDSSVPPGPFTVTRYRLRSRERLLDQALCVLRCILTPRVMHYSLVRLPPRLAFLYCPIKLVHDYVLLPAWLAFKFIRSQRTRRTAREPG